MEKDFEKIMESIEVLAKKDAEEPVIISLCKEAGLNGKTSIVIKGPDPCIYAHMCELLPRAVNNLHLNADQKRSILDLIYEESKHELELNRE